MFLKQLKISSFERTIRDIRFRKGLNLIIDNTPTKEGSDKKETGNNVGKTTVLMLIDFCLGASGKQIYTDPENRREEYSLVKSFLVENEVLISLTLKEDLDNIDSREILIERNFLSRKKKIQAIDGLTKTDDEFEEALTSILFPGHWDRKPTFRQIISHNIRYKDQSLNNTLYTLDRFTRDEEYETLYLFLLGCEYNDGEKKQNLLAQIRSEESFKAKFEKDQTKSAYEVALSLTDEEIQKLKEQKSKFNLNDNFEAELQQLNAVKYEINALGTTISRLELRLSIIEEAEAELQSKHSDADTGLLRKIYSEAALLIPNIQKSFEDLNSFHNQMIQERKNYISKDVPKIKNEIRLNNQRLIELTRREAAITQEISTSQPFEHLEDLIAELNEQYRKKGELENILSQIDKSEETLAELYEKLHLIDEGLFSHEFEQNLKDKITKFNKYFSSISEDLYGEKYAIKADQVIGKKEKRVYKFSAFNTNFSSGKKQGEITCFDLAYTLYADDEAIPCFHFLLNDKKELIHDNQLVRIAQLTNRLGVQFVASILRDKLPPELNKKEFFVIELSQEEKLFKIEGSNEL